MVMLLSAALLMRPRRRPAGEMIWGALRGRGVRREDDPAAWPPFACIDSLGGGGPFAAAGMSPAWVGADDELIGPGRWTPQVYAWRRGGSPVPVGGPGPMPAITSRAATTGPGGYRVNVRSRARGLLALLLFTDVGPGRRADPAGLRIASACPAVPGAGAR